MFENIKIQSEMYDLGALSIWHIKSIYESDPSSFNAEYEEIVKHMPEIVFVNNNMTVNDVVREVDERTCRSMRYHLDVRAVTVNGLNQSAKTIQEAEPILCKKRNITLTTEGSVSSLLKGKRGSSYHRYRGVNST